MGRLTPGTPVMIGGQSHRLVFDLNACVAFESMTGCNFAAFVGRPATEPPTITELRAFLWAGLQHEQDPAFATPEDVGRLITIGNLSEIFGAAQEAVAEALPDHPPVDDPNPQSRSTGSDSGASDGRTSD